MKKSVCSFLLALLMVFSLLPSAAFAATGDKVASGDLGSNLTWSLDSTGTLTISGAGKMPNLSTPWSSYRDEICSVIIENGVTHIGSGAFQNCSGLTSVTIPNSVTSVGASVFSGCSSLKSVSIPNSITKIGENMFLRCDSLTSVSIPNSVTSIGGYAFAYCHNLQSVTIPATVTDIGDSAFRSCSSLTSVTIPKGVTSIGINAFESCSSLTSVTIPSSVTGIGASAFSGTPWVKSLGNFAIANGILFAYQGKANDVIIPKGVTVIGSKVFEKLSTLTSVMIPDGVTKIEDSAFKLCSNLKSVTIPESVVIIGASAFQGCNSLPTIYIPAGVTEIDYSAFDSCRSLADIYYGGSEAQWNLIENNGSIPEQAEMHYGHTHSYPTQPNRSVAPTCTKSGYNEYHCVCGNRMRKTVKALGHNYQTGTCTRCGAKDPNYKPAAPTVKSGYVASSGKPYLSWNSVTGAAKYEVYRSGSKNGTYKLLGTTAKTNYTDTTASTGYTYYYKIKTVDAAGIKSNYSAAVSAVSHCAKPVVKSDYLSSTGKPYLSWNSVTGAAKYEVYRATSKNGAYKYLGSTTKTNYTDSSASAGYTYYYKIKAISKVKTAANSSYSTVISAVSHCARPVVSPSYLSSTGKPYLSWKSVTGAKSYYVYRATSKNGTYKYLGSTTKTNYTDSSASTGYTYYYKVKAVDTAGVKSSYSTAVSATSHCARPVVSITTSKGDPKLTWKAVTGAKSYEVYRATSKNGTYTKLGTTTKTSYTNTSAKAGTTYYYKVKAVSKVKTSANSSYSLVKSIKAK